ADQKARGDRHQERTDVAEQHPPYGVGELQADALVIWAPIVERLFEHLDGEGEHLAGTRDSRRLVDASDETRVLALDAAAAFVRREALPQGDKPEGEEGGQKRRAHLE